LLLEECLSSSFSPLVLLVVVDMILCVIHEVLPQEAEELARPIGSKPVPCRFTAFLSIFPTWFEIPKGGGRWNQKKSTAPNGAVLVSTDV